jgi:hypothetical protein
LRIFKFQGPSGTQTKLGFFLALIFSKEIAWEEKGQKRANDAQTSTSGVGPSPGYATLARLHLEPSMSSVLISVWRAWPKYPYIKTLRDILERRRRRNTKPWNRGWICEDWRGETLPEPSLVAFPTSPTSPKPSPWWRGSSPPLDYGFWSA